MARHEYICSFTSKERSRIMYEEFVPGFGLIVGKVNQTKAYNPIDEHIHKDSFEIVYIVKGKQIYNIGSNEYEVNSGECFITLPNEEHSSGGHPEDKSILYYVIIPYKLLNDVGFDEKESRQLQEILTDPPGRVFIGMTEMVPVLETLVTVPIENQILCKTKIKHNLTQFLFYVIFSMSRKPLGQEEPLTPILEYIQEHVKENISIQELAELMNLSESRFKVYFRKVIGIPPAEYILRQKVNVSKELLRNTNDSITEIAFGLSFSSSQYFSTVFKRFTTFSPARYRIGNYKIGSETNEFNKIRKG